MKSILTTAFLLFAATFTLKAQQPAAIVEKTITVYGDCDNCKINIERAASYVKGVKKAKWDKDKNELFVVFKNDKTSISAIEEAVAKAGYDTEHVKADQKAYDALPECCHYRTTEKH